MILLTYRLLSQVGSRRKRCPGQFGQDGMGSIPATPSTKHASCFPPSSMPASIEISIKLIIVFLSEGANLWQHLIIVFRACLCEWMCHYFDQYFQKSVLVLLGCIEMFQDNRWGKKSSISVYFPPKFWIMSKFKSLCACLLPTPGSSSSQPLPGGQILLRQSLSNSKYEVQKNRNHGPN